MATAGQSNAGLTSGANFVLPASEKLDRFELSRYRCRIHPAVIMSVLDSYSRNGKALGTLLGVVSAETPSAKGSNFLVDVLDCSLVAFTHDEETGQFSVEREQHEWMLKLREKVNLKLQVIGWMASTTAVSFLSTVHDWAKAEPQISRFNPNMSLPEPLIVSMDPDFKQNLSILRLIKAYMKGPLGLLFYEVPVEISLNKADVPEAGAILRTSQLKIDPNSPGYEESLVNSFSSPHETCVSELGQALAGLQESVLSWIKYIQEALRKGEAKMEVSQELMRAICVYTIIPKDELLNILEDSVQDNLMIALLVDLAKAQFSIAERLAASFS